MNMIHIALVKRIWLGSFFGLLFWAFIGIMALVVALEAKHLADIFLGFRIWAVLSIVMVMASCNSPKIVNLKCEPNFHFGISFMHHGIICF